MEYQEYLSEMKEIQEILLRNLDDEIIKEENYQEVISFFKNHKTNQNPYKIKETFHLIMNIINNHHILPNFYDFFEQIINLYKDEIQQNFSNYEIFKIFNSNKRILLFLFKEKILKPDATIAYTMQKEEYNKKFYLYYFYPEFKTFFNEKKWQSIDLNNCRLTLATVKREEIENDIEKFESDRNNGQNDEFICSLIRNDSVEEFITYVNKFNTPLNLQLKKSIFETNSFLIEKNPTLIEYSAFFGSIQIFKFLFMNQVQLEPSLWHFVIHGKNPELIHFLEDNEISPVDNSYLNCLSEAIKCHHNDIANYIQNNLLPIEKNNQNDLNMNSIAFEFFNFQFFPNDVLNDFDSFCDYCDFDNIIIVDLLLKKNSYDLNNKKVFK